MKLLSGILVVAACMPYMVWADSDSASDEDGESYAAAAAAAAAAADGDGASSAAAAAAAASSTSGSDRVIHCYCPLIYDPVCGTDGVTYSNECVLDCFNKDNDCNGRDIVKIHYKGVCSTVDCYCPSVWQPVCGTNHRTYPNECYLNCENAVRIKNCLKPFDIANYGVCRTPWCVCSDLIIPVCGTDGRTYRNVCILQYYSHINQSQGKPGIYVRDVGACKNETCYCSEPRNELCASDGRTYYNDCMLACYNRRLSQLGQKLLYVKHRGQCINCICTAEYNPVCANNDVTFSNRCEFLCENKKRQATNQTLLRQRWYGHCNCGCTNEWSPVCATNKQTYRNRCTLGCLNRKRKQDGLSELGIRHDGICYDCDCTCCGNTWSPVCGMDNRTYWNECWLDCINKCRIKSGNAPVCKKHDGECVRY